MTSKNIKITLKNGLNLDIPRSNIARMVMPGIQINSRFFKLVLEEDNMDRRLEEVRKKLF